MISESLDERATTILDALNVGKNQRVAALEAQIASAEEEKQSLKGFEEVFAVHRELNDMNRELTFRMQQHNARDAVEKQLNDFVARELTFRMQQHNARDAVEK